MLTGDAATARMVGTFLDEALPTVAVAFRFPPTKFDPAVPFLLKYGIHTYGDLLCKKKKEWDQIREVARLQGNSKLSSAICHLRFAIEDLWWKEPPQLADAGTHAEVCQDITVKAGLT